MKKNPFIYFISNEIHRYLWLQQQHNVSEKLFVRLLAFVWSSLPTVDTDFIIYRYNNCAETPLNKESNIDNFSSSNRFCTRATIYGIFLRRFFMPTNTYISIYKGQCWKSNLLTIALIMKETYEISIAFIVVSF